VWCISYHLTIDVPDSSQLQLEKQKRHGFHGFHRFLTVFFIRVNPWNPWRFCFLSLKSEAGLAHSTELP
jgi:hypothetical protein